MLNRWRDLSNSQEEARTEMTDLKIRLRMAWAVIRGRSVMYRWHSTSTGMIPKTLGALSVENTGNLELAIGLTNEEGAGGIEEPTLVERDNPPPVADLRGDVATALSGRRDPRSHRGDDLVTADQAVTQSPE